MPDVIYDDAFYSEQGDGSARSASLIVPLIMEMSHPRSVFDLGCGRGHWLQAFRAAGVPEIHGTDGPWLDPQCLAIDAGHFTPFDFAKDPGTPQTPLRRYEIATSFEVLEHMDFETSTKAVSFLSTLSDVLIVGAAIPSQGGTGHINEQWPSYWYDRFRAEGYECYDCIRPQIWNSEVDWWYAQNTIVYARGERRFGVREYALRIAAQVPTTPLPLVHPALLAKKVGYLQAAKLHTPPGR